MWDLVWSGEVTNDTMAPLRAFLSGRRASSSRRPRVPSAFPPHAAGRWSLVTELVDSPVANTRRATAWADQLLERHGVVTRAGVLAEGIPGGFSGLYPVLNRMEETGRVRRGYFIEGQGGAQFAVPGAVDRLRGPKRAQVTMLAATDPANPYGASLDWPTVERGRIGRIAGTSVILVDGRLAGFLDGRRLRTFEDVTDRLEPIAAHLADLGRRHHRLSLELIDDEPIGRTVWAAPLSDHGFAPAPKGLVFRGDRARR